MVDTPRSGSPGPQNRGLGGLKWLKMTLKGSFWGSRDLEIGFRGHPGWEMRPDESVAKRSKASAMRGRK